ncbi:MAG TPA: malto-oligosyltrehalose trehalohydrolase, partial [bacterium]
CLEGERARTAPMEPAGAGYHRAVVEDVPVGARYRYRLDGGRTLPDPASRWQPDGVHGASAVAPEPFPWTDHAWRGRALTDYVLYELHVGTATPEGTFEALIPMLDGLRDLGVTAIELMPVAQFPGRRNWGYDGAYPFAPQHSYGGPGGLRRLIDAAHERGLAVTLDVVYNHLGPEGNDLGAFGPYFTDRYRGPWGAAINFDGPGSDEVRRYFIENALGWVRDFHVDALRLDAIHGIFDVSARPFLAELGAAVHAEAGRAGRAVHVIPESDLNDPRAIRPAELGGWGLDAQWNDDFHHALHALLTGERQGYYRDFGTLEDLASAWREGYVYAGRHSAFRGRRHGAPARACGADRFVIFSQNHDQVGNRMLGERLSALAPFDALKLAAGMVLFAPGIPLLFMGEEYGETAPFLYFIEHGDPGLIEAVRQGRSREFAAFGWQASPPDPQAEDTFRRSRLTPAPALEGRHRALREFYREALALRRAHPALARADRDGLAVTVEEAARLFLARRGAPGSSVFLMFHFGAQPAVRGVPVPPGRWRKRLDSAEWRWAGPGSAVPEDAAPGAAQWPLAPYQCAVFAEEA